MTYQTRAALHSAKQIAAQAGALSAYAQENTNSIRSAGLYDF